MILFIDSSAFDRLHFALIDPVTGKAKEKKIRYKHNHSEKTAGYLEEFLRKSDLTKKLGWRKVVSEILVVSGPGSFTGIRTGIALGMAIAMALDIKIYALKKEQVPKNIKGLLKIPKSEFKKVNANFDPEYGVEPNITTEKK